jgi:hypothetical protein
VVRIRAREAAEGIGPAHCLSHRGNKLTAGQLKPLLRDVPDETVVVLAILPTLAPYRFAR